MNDGPFRTGWPRASWALAYFGLYFAYLWWRPENELAHWLTLVALPWLLLWARGPRANSRLRLREVGRRLGLFWPRRGLGTALVLMVLVQGIQLMNAPQRVRLADTLSSSQAVWIVPVAFLVALVTAGFTEEFFFRGILQRSLGGSSGSLLRPVLGASVLFSLYHIPYAYLNPAWPSSGNLLHAVQLAFTNGMLGGVILGLLFERSRGSLVPCVLVHAAVNWIPTMGLLAKVRIEL